MKTPECPIKPLSLDGAISHADEVAGDCSTACKREHKQLADWLRELKSRRSAERGDCAALREVVELVANMNVDGAWNGSASICELVGKAKAALAKPARNCDRFRGPLAYYESLDVYIKEEERPVAEDGKGDSPLSYEEALERMNKYRQWLFAPATEKEGGNNAD